MHFGGELPDNDRTHRKFRLVRSEGTREVERDIDHYDLNALIAVGYRVGSVQGTMFRVWATDKLFTYLQKPGLDNELASIQRRCDLFIGKDHKAPMGAETNSPLEQIL